MKKIFLKFLPIFSLLFLSPVISLAEFIGPCPAGTYNNGSACVPNGIGGILYTIQDLLGSALPVLIALGVVYLVWGIVQYVIYDSEEAKTKGKDRIIYGIIGLAVVVSLWGLVNILVDTFFAGQGQILNAPSLEKLTGPAASCNLEGKPKVQDLLCYVTRIINDSIIPLLFALAVVMFVWGTINFFIINADEEAKRAQGKQFMIWGIIALAVMISVWGLVTILGTTFGIENTSVLPQVKPRN